MTCSDGLLRPKIKKNLFFVKEKERSETKKRTNEEEEEKGERCAMGEQACWQKSSERLKPASSQSVASNHGNDDMMTKRQSSLTWSRRGWRQAEARLRRMCMHAS